MPARVKELGWAFFEQLTSAQVTQLDINAAQAADGSLWSEVAILKNLLVTSPTFGKAMLYDPTTHRWIKAHNNLGFPVAEWTYNGKTWPAGSLPAGDGLSIKRNAVAQNNGVLLLGGTPGSSSTSKFRRSVDGGTTWTEEQSSRNTTAGVMAITYHAASSVFIGAHYDGAIETSSDGETWEQMFLDGTRPHVALCSNGSRALVQSETSGGVSAVMYSDDGATWTASDMPSGFYGIQVGWSERDGRFYAFNSTGSVYSSADGAVWTLGTLVGSNIWAATIFRGLLVIAVPVSVNESHILYSADGGTTWHRVNSVAAEEVFAIAASDERLVISDDTPMVHTSIAGGF